MINREKLNKILDAQNELEGIVLVEITIYSSRDFRVWVTPPSYFAPLSEEARHKALAVLTPLVGRIERKDETDYFGSSNGIDIYLSRATECKILGYKKVKKIVKKEIARVPEYEEVEEEVSIPITDCDVKNGKATEAEIEVPA